MKILKLIKDVHGHYSVVFDEIPEITYECIGLSYVGTAINSNGEIILSKYLKCERYGGACTSLDVNTDLIMNSLCTASNFNIYNLTLPQKWLNMFEKYQEESTIHSNIFDFCNSTNKIFKKVIDQDIRKCYRIESYLCVLMNREGV